MLILDEQTKADALRHSVNRRPTSEAGPPTYALPLTAPSQPFRLSSLRSSSSSASTSSAPLLPFSSSSGTGLASSTTLVTHPPPVSLDPLQEERQRLLRGDPRKPVRRRKQTRRALLVGCAFVTYSVALVALIMLKPWKRSWIDLSANFPPPNKPDPHIRATRPPMYVPPNAPPEDGTAIACNTWDFSSPEASRLKFQYPANLTSFFVRGYDSDTTTGTFQVRTDQAASSAYEIQFQLRGRFGGPNGEIIDVCMMKGKGPDEYGLGIYNVTSRNSTHSNYSNHSNRTSIHRRHMGGGGGPSDGFTDYDINLVLPRNTTRIPALSTRLPGVFQLYGKGSNLSIDDLSIGGPASRFELHLNDTRRLHIDSAIAIRGYMAASESVTLKSRGSEINANITMFNRGYPWSVSLESSNAPITSQIRLNGLNKTFGYNSSQLAHYVNVSATTQYAPVNVALKYDHSPRPVSLALQAKTISAPVNLDVPPAFEGTFALAAQGSKANVKHNDISVSNRTRTVQVYDDEKDDHAHGTIIWLDEDEEHRPWLPTSVAIAPVWSGHVDATTNHANAVLALPSDTEGSPLDEWPPGTSVG